MDIYQQTRKIINEEIEQLPITDSVRWHFQFAAFSANLQWLMPDIPVEQHNELFRQTLLNQRLANLDECYFRELSIHLNAECAVDRAGLTNRPSVVCTYHLGSYRLLPHWLMAQGVSICMPLAPDVLEVQGDGMLAAAEETCRQSGATCTLIDAGDPLTMVHMLTALKNGKTIVAYLDGNMGTLPNAASTNLVTTPFLAGEILVRTGLAAVAYIAGVPIHSMVSGCVTDRSTVIQCLQTIKPGKGIKRADFARQTTINLYRDLQGAVKQQPWMWENWLSIHEQLY